METPRNSWRKLFELEQKLLQALIEEGDELDMYYFEISCSLDITYIMNKLSKKSRKFENSFRSYKNSGSLKTQIEDNSSIEEKLSKNFGTMYYI